MKFPNSVYNKSSEKLMMKELKRGKKEKSVVPEIYQLILKTRVHWAKKAKADDLKK
jgi:hypothetical protein